MRFTVRGKIVPAVRMTQKSKCVNGQAQRYLVYKDAIGYRAKEANCVCIADPERVSLHIFAYAYKRKWDLSNVIKAVEDACNHICWDDDRQIVSINALVMEVASADVERLEIIYHPFGDWSWHE